MATQLSKLCGMLQRAAVDCRPLLTAAPYNWSSLAGILHSSTAPTLSTAPQGPQTYDSATTAFRPWAESRRFSSTSDAEQLPGDKDTDLALRLSEAVDVDQILDLVESEGLAFDEESVEQAVKALARCCANMDEQQLQEHIHNNRSFQTLADMLVQGAARHSGPALTNVVAAFGQLRFRDEMVLDEISRHLMAKVENLDQEHLHNLVEGLAQVDHSPSILLLDAVSERLHQLGGVKGEEGSKIQERLKDLGHDGSVGDQGMSIGKGEGKKKEQPGRANTEADYA